MNREAYATVLRHILQGTTPDDRSTRLANGIELSYTPPQEGEDVHKLKIVHHRYELNTKIAKVIERALQTIYQAQNKVYMSQNWTDMYMVEKDRVAILRWKLASVNDLHTLPQHKQKLIKEQMKKLPRLQKKGTKQKQLI